MLQQIIGSQGRAEILKHLFTPEHKNTHLRELSRWVQLSAPVLQRELRQLVELGLVSMEKDGNRIKYSANSQHALYGVLCDLVRKTEGVEAVLTECFADTSAEWVFLFGSFARGTAKAGSDIDLFVIGDCGLRDVTRRIHQAAQTIGLEINPYVITRTEFMNRKARQDHFIMEILASPKIFLKGAPHEFSAMAE